MSNDKNVEIKICRIPNVDTDIPNCTNLTNPVQPNTVLLPPNTCGGHLNSAGGCHEGVI
jgi:hypothetical protein